jgi:cryptochrome
MLDEKHEKERCIARLKIAFTEGLHGDAPEVLAGSAEGILKRKFRDAMGNEEDEDAKDGLAVVGQKRKAATGPMDSFVKKSKT